MSTLFVTYPGGSTDRFDRDYYVATHLPLVVSSWGPHGLTSAQAYFPATGEATEVAIAILAFESDEAVGAALASAATPAVLADVANFTDIAPVLSRGVPL